MNNKQKVFTVIAAIVIGTTLTWYLQVYRKKQHATKHAKEFIATIPPVKFIVQQIVGDDFKITTLLPEGASPETYEPTPKQISSSSKAEIIFATGLIDFEKTLTDKIAHNTNASIAILSKNIALKEGECTNTHAGDSQQHNHGIDPHIWTSVRCLKIMADNAYVNIKALYPDSSKYFDNYLNLIRELDTADSAVRDLIKESDIKYFLIYHPALSYYADDYNITQVSIEHEGKEPTADHIASIIKQAKQDSVHTILYQKQLNQSVVMTAAEDIGATPVAFDPLAENVIQNLLWVTETITRR